MDAKYAPSGVWERLIPERKSMSHPVDPRIAEQAHEITDLRASRLRLARALLEAQSAPQVYPPFKVMNEARRIVQEEGRNG